jgi:hypothetical protein
MRSKCSGRANRYLEAAIPVGSKVTLPELEKLLRNEFKPAEKLTVRLRRFRECKQLPDESSQCYGLRLRSLGLLTCENDKEKDVLDSRLLAQLLEGLYNTEVVRYILTKDAKTFQEALDLAREAESNASLLASISRKINVLGASSTAPSQNANQRDARIPQFNKTGRFAPNVNRPRSQQFEPTSRFSRPSQRSTTDRLAQNSNWYRPPRQQNFQQPRMPFPRTQQPSYQPRTPTVPRGSATASRQNPTFSCHYCQKLGHRQFECRKRLYDEGKCYICYQKNHVAAQCSRAAQRNVNTVDSRNEEEHIEDAPEPQNQGNEEPLDWAC